MNKRKNYTEILLAFLLIFAVVTGYATEYAKVTGGNIADSVVRLHVIANSNSAYDRNIKLKVRDEVINYLSPILKDAKSTKETKELILKNINGINETAKTVIIKNGGNYNVKSELKDISFPTKHYGDTAFPAGKYQSLQIVIGEGKGDNWWCVLYPQLCINNFTQKEEPSDNGFARLSDESKKKLKEVLSPEEYEIISNTDKKEIKIKFKILELFNR